jgi:preprotein translocase subunit SecG
METLLIIIHIIVCFFLVAIVLLQHGKGADMGATFGGSSQTVFGTEGPLPLLNKITTASAVIFMLTSISLAYLSTNRGDGSVMQEVQSPIATEKPEEPTPSVIPLPPSTGAGETGQTGNFPATDTK